MATRSGTPPTRRTAVAIAAVILAAVAIVAALFPNTILLAEIPERGNGVEDLRGRTFVAVEATEGGRPYQLREDHPISVSFDLDGMPMFMSACGEIRTHPRLDEGRFDWREGPPTYWHECSGRRQVRTEWLETFLAERPAWQLDGNTLELSSDFGTMTLVDKGEGSDPAEILGETFYGHPYESADKAGKPRIRANLWLTMSFDRDGMLRVRFGCDRVVVPIELRAGWFRITEALLPQRTTDCSRSMARQQTAWLWELLRHPVRWQTQYDQWVMLKPYRSAQEPLALSRVFERDERRTEPGLLADRTFHARPNVPFIFNLDGYDGIEIVVGDDGSFTASAGCEQPSIHGRFRTGWVDFGENLDWTLAACEDVEAEQWLADYLAHEPTWYLRNDGLNLHGAGQRLHFTEPAGSGGSQ